MTSVHPVRPTDLVALVAFDGRVYPNEAVTRDRAGTPGSPHPIETALEQWFSFATGRHAWISVKGATLRGLVSARRRGSRAAWELDCLIDAAEDDANVLLSLLERVTQDAGHAGAEKVFVRVSSGSGVANAACRAGFAPFVSERLLVLEGRPEGAPQAGPPAGLRRWTRADAYPTFRLYSRWAPASVRQVEAPTFREWQAARERLSPPRTTRQWTVEQDGRIAGWLRTAVDGSLGRFDIVADPSMPDVLERLADAALARLAGQEAVLALVPDFAGGLRERLERRGFRERANFISLARRTAQPVQAPQLAPAARPPTLLA